MTENVTTSKGACGLSPLAEEQSKGGVRFGNTAAQHAVMAQASKLWKTGQEIKYAFVGGTENQKAAVTDVVQEWTYYVHLTLTPVPDVESAQIRIAFEPNGGSWSAVGRDALRIKDSPTMNLGWIADINPPSVDDRGTILHEWGHALGLMHEHQSPARGGTIRLKNLAVYEYYHSTQGWDNALIKSQIIDVYNTQKVSNFSKLDTASIMMYFMPGYLNDQNLDVPVNNKLSDLDKAYMVINYPRPEPHPKAQEWTLYRALQVAGVPPEETTAMIQCKDPLDTRTRFADWNIKTMVLSHAEDESYPNGLPDDVQQGLFDFIKKVAKNPLLKDILTGAASTLTAQHGLQPTDRLATNPTNRSVPPADAQQGLFDFISSVAKNPVFKQVVSGIVDGVLTQRGLQSATITNPPATATDVQNTLRLGPPPFIQPLQGFATNAMPQRGLQQPGTTTQALNPSSADVQQGIFSALEKIVKHPSFNTIITNVVNNAMTQRGLQPLQAHAAINPPLASTGNSAASPEVQQGIFDALTRVVSGVVNGVLSQHGLQHNHPPSANPDAGGLSSTIPSDVEHGLIGNILGSLFPF